MTLIEYELPSFGALLKGFRTHRHLTQQQLAALVGVHRNAISRWEQGNYLPENKGIVLELTRHLYLDDQEARQFLEASFTALSPYWQVPIPRNPFFTGREAILEALHAQLSANQTGALIQSYALYGLGGVGKTQIALEYAYRHALEHSAVFWIEAETIESIVASMVRIAEVLQLPVQQEKDHQRIVAMVQRWLSSHKRWLLIWDNLEDPTLPQRLLPSTLQGAILITTQCQVLGTLTVGMELAPMELQEGMLFVLRRAKLLSPEATYEHLQQFAVRMPSEYAAAEELVSLMGALPLALDQAGAYIEETGCSVSNYLYHYEQQRIHLLDRRGMLGGDHPHSVTTTFLLAKEQVEQEQRMAADVLHVCAFLHVEAIPEEFFVAGAPHLGPELAALAADPSQFDQAIAVLRRFSLVQRHAETHSLSLHRLLQAVLHERMGEHERAEWQRRVIVALSAVFPEVTYDSWEQCERLLPHTLACMAATKLAQAQEDTRERRSSKEPLKRFGKERVMERESFASQAVASPFLSEKDHFQEFLSAHCKLYPRAWSFASDLWQTYAHWAEDHQESFPLSRRAFAAQLRVHGCYTDRTSTARIWRGVALVNREP